MTPHMGKRVMKEKTCGLLEQHKALPCWERRAEDKNTTSVPQFLWAGLLAASSQG